MSATITSANPAYSTQLGAAYVGDSLRLMADLPDGSVNLVITSPPFALQRQKEYGNFDQNEYVDWLMQLGGWCTGSYARMGASCSISVGPTKRVFRFAACISLGFF